MFLLIRWGRCCRVLMLVIMVRLIFLIEKMVFVVL